MRYLQSFNLSNNNILIFVEFMFLLLIFFLNIDIFGNNFVCDCYIYWISVFLRVNEIIIIFIDFQNLICILNGFIVLYLFILEDSFFCLEFSV